ncbi:MAG: toxin-antitoxin system antitoxin subunit [Deltaproteobacteria bacterium HGW-Deltaproteobacteria-15]|jgi:uncharacterized protein with HEPN domain|nr:MAG: toxin-antitoxin system antitoxin subunit [Deltaproteobacteria bacterium HGW-Deltaproteobacteria-15]
MPKEEIIDSVELIVESIGLVQERFLNIGEPDDFVRTPEGVTLLDAIVMRLQVIGESVKQIQKIDSSFFLAYPEIEWEKISRFRDLVSHHYDHVDHEIVYDICKTHIPLLIKAVQRMRAEAFEDLS